MSNLSIPGHPVGFSTEDLNALLLSSHKYGKMRLFHMDSGWYAAIAMNTNTTGTSFEVKSDFTHLTPLKAAQTCLDRMFAALKQMKGG